MTMIGFCVETFRLDPSPPALVEGTRELTPVGGFFSDHGSGFVNFSLYPPTTATHVRIVDDEEGLGDLQFQPVEETECQVRVVERGPVTVLDCDSLLVLAWDTALQQEPGRVELADVEVGEEVEGNQWRLLDFYLHGLTRSRQGRLRIEFAIPYPTAPSVRLRLKELYVQRRTDIVRLRLDERQEVRFQGLPRPPV